MKTTRPFLKRAVAVGLVFLVAPAAAWAQRGGGGVHMTPPLNSPNGTLGQPNQTNPNLPPAGVGTGLPTTGLPNQAAPNQAIPNQGFPNQGFPNQQIVLPQVFFPGGPSNSGQGGVTNLNGTPGAVRLGGGGQTPGGLNQTNSNLGGVTNPNGTPLGGAGQTPGGLNQTNSNLGGVTNLNGAPGAVSLGRSGSAGFGQTATGLSPFSFGASNLPANLGGGFTTGQFPLNGIGNPSGGSAGGLGVPGIGNVSSITPTNPGFPNQGSVNQGLIGARNPGTQTGFGGVPLGGVGTVNSTTGMQGGSPVALGGQPHSGTVGSPALLHINVPGNAQVSVQGVPLNQNGNLQLFMTPNLATGSMQSFNVRAEWTENGRQMSSTQNVIVSPGDQVGVTMMGGSPVTVGTGR